MAVACLAWVGVLVAFTWRQVSDYVDVETLWTHTLAKNPDAWIAAHNLGVRHMERHEYPEAEHYFTRVVEIQPDNARAKQSGAAGAVQAQCPWGDRPLRKVDRCRPELSRRAAQSLPAGAESKVTYARPKSSTARLAVEPSVAESQESLALEIMQAADPEMAQQFLDDALNIQPVKPRLISELAWALVTSQADDLRDSPRALSLARKAVETTGSRDAKTLVLLAAAYASSGDYARAADVARQALRPGASNGPCGPDRPNQGPPGGLRAGRAVLGHGRARQMTRSPEDARSISILPHVKKGQRRFQPLHALLRHLGSVQSDPPKIGHAPQLFQAGIR